MDGSHRLNGMPAADGLRVRLGKAEVQHLALRNQVLDCSGHILDGDLWIDTMLVVEIDAVGLEALQRALDHLLDVIRPAVDATGLDVKAELRGDADAVAEGRERFTDEF